MLQKTALILLAAAVQLIPAHAGAQAKVIPGERQTMKATVEAVDSARRSVTIRTENGALRTVYASAEVTRLAEIKPGDTVTATYYDNIIIRKKAAGEPDVDTRQQADHGRQGRRARPGPPRSSRRSPRPSTRSILAAPSISLKGPRGWTYASQVQDKKALQQVAVGDRVDITWTEATLVSVAPAKK